MFTFCSKFQTAPVVLIKDAAYLYALLRLFHSCPFQALGLSASSTKDEVKKAFRKKALLYHPDKDPSANAKTKFQDLKEAMEECIRRLDGKEPQGFGSTGYTTYTYSHTGYSNYGNPQNQQQQYARMRRKQEEEARAMRGFMAMNYARHKQQAINNVGIILIIGILFYLSTISTVSDKRREFILQLKEAERRHRNEYETMLEKAKTEYEKDNSEYANRQIMLINQELKQLHEGRQSRGR
eukprot:TRINITY_DN19102_c0_g3_i2.p3 TRINITY_DN19102_c0_g3~~TRINITY_DN19102_c0_g3_i2.p3  ORF type:complete len:260 (-),score=26.61 TRINITY_DN19102_c0_g3_i2:1423-2139(-)